VGCWAWPVARAQSVQSVSQTVTLTQYSYGFFNGASQLDLNFFPSPLTAMANPFNSALGTLQSFSTSVSFSASFTGTAGSMGGDSGAAFSGIFEINGAGFDSGGAGNGGGGGPGAPISYTAAITNVTNQFAIPVQFYDPMILAAVTGSTPFEFEFVPQQNQYLLNAYFDNITSGLFAFSGSFTITYNYIAVAEPGSVLMLAPMLGALGFVRRRRTRR